MKSALKRQSKLLVVVGIVGGFLAGFAAPGWAGNANPGVIPPQAEAYGMSYGEWSARWWQWAFALPVDQSPFFDDNGNCSHGANGQLGPVWFLAGVLNASGTAVRDCTLPAGKALFFPLINVECSTLEAPPFYGSNEAELRACAAGFTFDNVFAAIDGVPVHDLARYLVVSPAFTFTLPPDNTLGLPPGTGQSVSNGYYLLLAPLAVGQHTLHFGGTYSAFNFSLDITYHLTIAPRRP
jgi:hypothetical protein